MFQNEWLYIFMVDSSCEIVALQKKKIVDTPESYNLKLNRAKTYCAQKNAGGSAFISPIFSHKKFFN
jgi:hypothetical protein